MPSDSVKPMPKQVSALNTFWLIEYLREHHSHVSVSEIVQNINQKNPYFVENLKTGKIEKINLNHLEDTEYWFSSAFMIDLYNEIQSRIPDPLLAYKMGRTSYKAQPILTTAIGVPLLGPKGIMKRIVKENSKYNRIMDNIILEAEKGHVLLRLVLNEGIKSSTFAMEWHRGVYEAYTRLSGATDVNIQLNCVDYDKGIWDFDIRFKEPPFLNRILGIVLFNIPTVKKAIDQAEEIQLEHIEQILNRDKIIEQKTAELRRAQAKLVEAEKRSLEHRITGGFAHEMRNALAGAQLEFKTTLNYKSQGKSSAEILKDAATTLLKNVSDLHREFNIPREKIATLLLPQLKTIAEIADHLGNVHADVSHDLDRGLSITTQIRNYARMSEFKPGNDTVDIILLLKGYGDRYRQDFVRIGIAYNVKGPDNAVVKADETHINSIFSNLVLNAKEALEEIDTDKAKEIQVEVDEKHDEIGDFFSITVSDNGPGIAEEHMDEIFEPFFSTKPTSGTGLGLGIVKRLVQLYGGSIKVESTVGQGTAFTVCFPYDGES